MIDALCVGAHPDDVEIGMGGAVASMVDQGYSVVLCDLTDGEPTPRGTRDMRMAEAAEAARILGVRRVTLTQPNRYLADTVEARMQLAEVIRELKPKWLFSPHPIDAHPDHLAAAAIVTAARFHAKFSKTDMAGEPHYPPRLYRYMAVHLRLNAEPKFLVDIGGVLERKMAALRAYQSQFSGEPGDGIVEHVRLAAEWWGSRVGTTAAEPFFSDEAIGVTSFGSLL